MNQRPIKGIIVPLVTPLTDDGQLDVEHLHRLIDHVIEAGVNGIFILGTTGEACDLSDSVRQQLIEHTCQYIDHRVIIQVGITHPKLSNVIAMARVAEDNGADAVVLHAPFSPITQKELLEYTKRVIRETQLPLLLYNKPDCAESMYAIETLKQLIDTTPVAGIKDSSGDMAYFKKLIQLKTIKPDWLVLMGPEELLAEAIGEGADGGVTGGANLFPRLYVNLYNAAVQENISEIRRFHNIVETIVENIYRPDYMTGLKYALSYKKLCSPILADPQRMIAGEQKKRIEQFLESFNESCL